MIMPIDNIIDIFTRLANNNQKEVDYQNSQVNFLTDLITDLENEQMSSRAKKYFYEKYREQLTKYNYQKYLAVVKTDLAVAQASLKIENTKLERYKRLCFALEYRQIIGEVLLDFAIKTLGQLGIHGPVLIEASERLKVHNTNVLIYRKIHYKYPTDKYLVINLLQHGYENIPKLSNDRSYELDFIVEDYLINGYSLEETIADIGVNNPHFIDDCKYIYTEILRRIQSKIYDLITMLKTEEYYFDNEILRKIKEEYINLYHKYMVVRELLDSIEPEYLGDEIDYLDDFKENPTNKLYYATNSDEPEKCYFYRDLTDIREESINKIWQMLIAFKNGEKQDIKHINNGYIELKHDQIRIIIRLLGGNNYSVEGVFIKKSDNLIDTYHKMYARPIASINDEYALAVEAACQDYVFANARIGTR